MRTDGLQWMAEQLWQELNEMTEQIARIRSANEDFLREMDEAAMKNPLPYADLIQAERVVDEELNENRI